MVILILILLFVTPISSSLLKNLTIIELSWFRSTPYGIHSALTPSNNKTDNSIYVHLKSGQLVSLNRHTGTINWSKNLYKVYSSNIVNSVSSPVMFYKNHKNHNF